MEEQIKVNLVEDDGHKRRWGFENLIYRKEGRKTSLNGRITAWFFGIMVLTAALYSVTSEFFNPTRNSNSEPIAFNEAVGQNSTNVDKIKIPEGVSEYSYKKEAGRRTGKLVSYSGPQVISRPNFGKIPPGTVVKAKFSTGASNGPLKAVLTEPVIVNGEELMPLGTILIGSGSSGDDRLTVQFTKIVFKDGSFQSVQAQGCDLEDQTVGVRGKKISKYAVMLAAGAGLNFLGGVAQGLQENEIQNGVATKKSDLRNAALNGASKAALDQSQEILTDLKNKKTIIQVDPNTEFYVLFEGES